MSDKTTPVRSSPLFTILFNMGVGLATLLAINGLPPAGFTLFVLTALLLGYLEVSRLAEAANRKPYPAVGLLLLLGPKVGIS